MAIPKQVEQELKAIEELEQQMKAPAESGEQTTEAPQPEATEPQTAEVEPTQVVAQEVPEETWAQKYRTLQYKYDAEVPRLHAQLKELTGQMQYMHQQLEAKQSVQEEPKQDRLVTDQDREAFGEDLIDLQRRVAQEVAGKYEAKLEAAYAKIDELAQRLQHTGNQVGEMTFDQKLHRAIPDFEQVNTDPRWIEWLNAYSPEIRGPRRALAEQAYNAGDIEGVAHYVSLFKQTIAAPKPNNRKAELERQVAPSRNATTGSVVQPQGKTYSQADWEHQYRMVDHLAARGRIDEAQQLEAELSAARMQGRVTA